MSDQNDQTTPPSGDEVSAAQPFYNHPPGFRRRRGRNWFFLGLTYAGYYFCRYNLSYIAPELKDALNLSNAQYGLIQSSRNFFYAIGQFVNGLFTDRLGGKRAMTIGAIATIILNVIFGLTTYSSIGWIFAALVIVRGADGYAQAFGAPGMVKINTAWFRRQERGSFAGIFGIMINLGQMASGQTATMLVKGASIPLLFFTLTIPVVNWRYMFFVPAVTLAIIVVIMNLTVKNNPEEAGFKIKHDEESEDDDPHEKIPLGVIFGTIASNPIVWIVAGAYFCTGFVRAAIYDWWTIYLDEAWMVGKDTKLWWWVAVVMLPLMASFGSLSSGIISDKLFNGRRAPVATVLYLIQAVFLVLAMIVAADVVAGSAMIAVIMILGIHTGCNATHSILGTAAAMDLGGRKMAGFAAGVIDSFQYFGAMLAGFGLGYILDQTGTPVFDEAGVAVLDRDGIQEVALNGFVWFSSMLPWAIVGTLLMGYLWIKHRGKQTLGT